MNDIGDDDEVLICSDGDLWNQPEGAAIVLHGWLRVWNDRHHMSINRVQVDEVRGAILKGLSEDALRI